MPKSVSDADLFACQECGLHYSDEATALACAAWCKEHNSCNLDITSMSVERNPAS